MIQVDVYNSKGQKKGKISLNPEVFGREINRDLLHQVIIAYVANKRLVQADTKTRGQVRGGGRKPWRQKGTGRARAGSNRSPIWQGGGVVFGPTSDRNYKKKIPQAMKSQAVTIALSTKVSKNHLLVLDRLTIDKPKTKELNNILDNLPFERSALLVLPKIDEKILRAGKNISYLKILPVSDINAYNLLKFNYLIATKESVQGLEDRLVKKTKIKNKNSKKQNLNSKINQVDKNDSEK